MTTKELIDILRDEDNCNVLDYIADVADRLEELAKVEAERDNLKMEVELLRSHVTELEEDWVLD